MAGSLLAVSTRGRLAPRTLASYSFGRRIFLTPPATARLNPPKLRHQNDRSSDVGTDTLSSRRGGVLSVNRPTARVRRYPPGWFGVSVSSSISARCEIVGRGYKNWGIGDLP